MTVVRGRGSEYCFLWPRPPSSRLDPPESQQQRAQRMGASPPRERPWVIPGDCAERRVAPCFPEQGSSASHVRAAKEL